MTPFSLSARHLRSTTAERPFRKSGTDGSNPLPSRGESAANLIPRQIMTAPAMTPFHIRRITSRLRAVSAVRRRSGERGLAPTCVQEILRSVRAAAWIFEGIDDEILGDFGMSGGGAAGFELDRADFELGTPPDALILARSEAHQSHHVVVPEDTASRIQYNLISVLPGCPACPGWIMRERRSPMRPCLCRAVEGRRWRTDNTSSQAQVGRHRRGCYSSGIPAFRSPSKNVAW